MEAKKAGSPPGFYLTTLDPNSTELLPQANTYIFGTAKRSICDTLSFPDSKFAGADFALKIGACFLDL